ncbi:MAG: hypothetical protein U0599_26975 [Vicinamibacteria bacterium]
MTLNTESKVGSAKTTMTMPFWPGAVSNRSSVRARWPRRAR